MNTDELNITPPPPAKLLSAAEALSSSPCYLLSEGQIEENCRLLREVADASGARVVIAQKAFAQPQLYPLIGSYLHGACASGLWEARLAREYLPPEAEILTCSPAYRAEEVSELLPLTDHLDFNSLSQWQTFKEECLEYQRDSKRQIQFGLRINPEHSTGETSLYDPCAPGSRLGVTRAELENASPIALEGLSGLHFHTLCEQPLEDLAETLAVVEKHVLPLFPNLSYLNLGGGHWITKDGYDREGLIFLLKRLREHYQLQVYLEPGEAVVIHSGALIGTVLDIHVNGDVQNAILDLSATAHMPDVLEMPYRPDVYLLSGEKGTEEGTNLYRLGGNTCLAGDVIGDYAFTRPLKTGERLLFNDMAHYTMVKTTFFNGVPHPEITLLEKDGTIKTLRSFSYEDFKRMKG